MLTVIALLVTGESETPIDLVKIPTFQGSVKVYSVDGEAVRYTQDLKYIDNIGARTMRHLLEPKVSG